MVTGLAEEAGIPWAAVFGKHDDQPLVHPWCTNHFGVPEGTPAQTPRSKLVQYDTADPLSRTSCRFTSSIGAMSNGYLLIDRKTGAQDPAAVLWFLDTGGGSLEQVLLQDQLDWLNSTAARLQEKHGALPGLLFQHIPLEDYPDIRFGVVRKPVDVCSSAPEIQASHVATMPVSCRG